MFEILLNLNNPYFSLETSVFNQNFYLEFEKIEFEKNWVMHVYDAQEQPIVLGIKLVQRWPLFSHQNIIFMMLDEQRLVAYEAV